MAVDASQPTTIKFSTGRVIRRSRTVTAKAFAEVARQMQAKLRKAISRQGPPRSKQGHYPKKDTGQLHATTKVLSKGRTISIEMPLYGMFLDNNGKGFRHHHSGKQVIRPWYTPIITKQRRNWERKFNAAMRRHSK